MLFKKFLLLIFLLSTVLLAENEVALYEKQGSYIPLNLEFTNEYNQTKSLKDIIENKPTVLTLNYFDCPGLCSPLLHAVASVVDKLDLTPYKDYKVITISIEKNDTSSKALEKKNILLKTLTKPFAPQTWSFLTTTNQKAIDDITDSVGFKYQKRVKDGVVDYLHAGALIIISPTGKVTRYLNGITYLPFDLKLALIEASDEKTRPAISKTLLFCFAYDAKSKTYIFQAEKVLGSFIFGIVFLFFIYLIKTGRKGKENDK